MADRKVREYALHVRRDGVELLFRKLPEMVHPPGYSSFEGVRFRGNGGYLYAHYVVVLELEDGTLVEETTIRSIKICGGERFICPQPHGKDWEVQDNSSDNFTVYRRPLPKGERAIFADPDSTA